MVSAGVGTKTTKVNLENYIKLLRDHLLTSCKRIYPNENFILQQDGATSHSNRGTQTFLSTENITFIAKDDWRPQSHGLCHLEISAETVYKDRLEPFTENELKAKIKDYSKDITLNEIRKSIGCWRKMLRYVVALKG